MHIISAALFAVSANLDNFTLGVAYGMKKIRIGLWANLVIALCSCLGTYLAMELGIYVSSFVTARTANTIGSFVLILIGLWFLAMFIKDVRKGSTCQETGEAPLFGQEAEPQASHYREISKQEVMTLSFALAINNMGLGIGGSITGLSPWVTSVCTFFFSLIFIAMGQSLGRTCLSSLFGKYANLVSSVIILALGLYEILI